MSVGKMIADIMEYKGLKQVEVAQKAGIKPQTLNNIITRDSARVDVQIFLKICEVLEVPTSIFTKEAIEEFYKDHPNAKRIEPDTVPEPSEEEGKKETAPIKTTWDGIENKLSGLSDNELDEVETFLDFLWYKRGHSSDD